MKLESLKSAKFETLTESQMALVLGGRSVDSGGGQIWAGGTYYNYTADCFEIDDKTGFISFQEYQIDGKWVSF